MDVLLRFKNAVQSDWSEAAVLSAPDGCTLKDPYIGPGIRLPDLVRAAPERRLHEGALPDGLADPWEELSVAGTAYSFTTLTPQTRIRSYGRSAASVLSRRSLP